MCSRPRTNLMKVWRPLTCCVVGRSSNVLGRGWPSWADSFSLERNWKPRYSEHNVTQSTRSTYNTTQKICNIPTETKLGPVSKQKDCAVEKIIKVCIQQPDRLHMHIRFRNDKDSSVYLQELLMYVVHYQVDCDLILTTLNTRKLLVDVTVVEPHCK